MGNPTQRGPRSDWRQPWLVCCKAKGLPSWRPTVSSASVDDFHALVIPGGTVNADKLRTDGAAVAFVHDFVESGKPVGVICHGPWTWWRTASSVAARDVLPERAYRPSHCGCQ